MIKYSTCEIALTAYDEDDAGVKTPIDLTAVVDAIFVLYQDGNKVLAKWSITDRTAEGYKRIDISNAVDAAIGKCIVRADIAETKQAMLKTGKSEFQVLRTNANFTGNKQVDIDTDIELEDFEQPVIKNAFA
jgi:hypothetical protein